MAPARRCVVVVVLGIVFLVGVVWMRLRAVPAAWHTEGVYAGYLYQVPNRRQTCSSFVPAGSTEHWYLVGISLDPAPKGYQRFVEVRGRLSPKGKYGPDKLYRRELRVTEVLTLRDPLPEEQALTGCPLW